MTIINTTTIQPEMVKGVMRASNFDNSKYKLFKMVYNLFGLLFGMMIVRYLVLEMIGSAKSDKVMLWFYIFATIILLYLGMVGMDRNNKKKFDAVYKKMIGVSFQYEIDSQEIVMTDPDNDSETFSWDKIMKWNQDMDNFYLFVGPEECLILDKKGFKQGSEKDLKDLATAIMGLRQSDEAAENTNQNIVANTEQKAEQNTAQNIEQNKDSNTEKNSEE